MTRHILSQLVIVFFISTWCIAARSDTDVSSSAENEEALVLAVQRRDRSAALSLLRYGVNPNSEYRYATLPYVPPGRIPLLFVVLGWSNFRGMCPNCDFRSRSGTKPCDLTVLKAFLDSGADPNARSQEGTSLLGFAIAYSDPSVVALLLKYGASCHDGKPYLGIAASNGHLKTVKLLLDREADVNERDGHNGLTALMSAAYGSNGWPKGGGENFKIVKYLLERGALVNPADIRGDTALHIAANFANPEIVRLLIENGADLTAVNQQGEQPLLSAIHEAFIKGDGRKLTSIATTIAKQNETVEVFLKSGADPNVADDNGDTALIRAACNSNTPLVRLLLDYGARVNARNNRAETALSIAIKLNQVEMVNLLRMHGATM